MRKYVSRTMAGSASVAMIGMTMSLLVACSGHSETTANASQPILYSDQNSLGAFIPASRDDGYLTRSFATGSLLRAQDDSGGNTITRRNCSATFISPHWAVTDAQCVDDTFYGQHQAWQVNNQTVCDANSYPVQMYRLVGDYLRNNQEYVPTTYVSNSTPDTWWSLSEAANTGYNTDTVCCSVYAKSNSAGSNIAVINCGDLSFSGDAGDPQYGGSTFAPGTVYGYLQMEQQTPDDFASRPVFMSWSHESINPFAKTVNPPVDVASQIAKYYTNLNNGLIVNNVPQNYHFENPSLTSNGAPLEPFVSALTIGGESQNLNASIYDHNVNVGACEGAQGSPVVDANTMEITGLMQTGTNLDHLLCQDPTNGAPIGIATKTTPLFFVDATHGGVINGGGNDQVAGELLNSYLEQDWEASGAPQVPTLYNWDFNKFEELGYFGKIWTSTYNNPILYNQGTASFEEGRNSGSITINPKDQITMNGTNWTYLGLNQAYHFGVRVLGVGGPTVVDVQIVASDGTLLASFSAADPGTGQVPTLATADFTSPAAADAGKQGASYHVTFTNITGTAQISEMSMHQAWEPINFLTANERDAWDLRYAGDVNTFLDYSGERKPMRFGGSFAESIAAGENSTTQTQAFVGVLYNGERMESRKLGLIGGQQYEIVFDMPRVYTAYGDYSFSDLMCGFWYAATSEHVTAPCGVVQQSNSVDFGLGVYDGFYAAAVVDLSVNQTPPDAFYIELPVQGDPYRWIEITHLWVLPVNGL